MNNNINLHENSRYIKKQKIKFSRSYLLAIVTNKILHVLVFLVVFLGLGCFGYYFVKDDGSVVVDNKQVQISSQKVPSVGESIVFVKESTNNHYLDKILEKLKMKEFKDAKVIGVPNTIANDGDKNVQLKPDEYLIKDKTSEKSLLINKDAILGTMSK